MKLVKANCSVSGKKIILQVNDDATEVLGFYKVGDESYSQTPSEIRLSPSARAKKPCATCGSATVFGCDHKFRSSGCGPSSVMSADCVTCNKLRPDYGRARSGSGTLQLRRGEIAQVTLSNVLIGSGWDCGNNGIDVDSSVILDDTQGNYELIYFGSLKSRDGSVVHRGDNLTGIDGDVAGNIDDENIDIELNRVDRKYGKIFIVINIFSGASTFGDIRNLYVTIKDADTGEEMIRYNVESGFERMGSLVAGILTRKGGYWEFKAIGEGFLSNGLDGLARYCVSKRW